MSEPEPGDRVLHYPLVALRQAWRGAWRRVLSVAVPGAVVLAVLGYLFRGLEQWGDVGTWVLTVTTLLALGAAVFASLVAYAVLDV